MFTSLDLLIIVVMALAAAALLSIALMFLIKNKTVRQVCLYIVAALGLYMGYVGIRIHYCNLPLQMLLAGIFGLTAIGAVALERIGKGDEKRSLIARILATAALIFGMINAFS